MNNKVTLKNIIASISYELVAIIYGFILPRLILCEFGSETNGLTASLGQFLNYIVLLEGGLSGVVKASLYKPLANNDVEKISAIINTAEKFFKKIALFFLLYSLTISIFYPIFFNTSFSWGYVFSLTLIISLSLFVQYFFSLTYKLLLTADRKGYIISYLQILFTIINLILSLIIINIYPQIHLLKFFNFISYLIQPFIFNLYVKKKYSINKKAPLDPNSLAQRWDGFGQNIAYFIHSNTDIVILTFFTSLNEVSVYSIYFMIANALKLLVVSVSGAITPSLGRVLSINTSISHKNEAFDLYQWFISTITVFVFTCGALLITPFISIYTSGINDVNYIRPVFGYILIFSQAIYCLREPYVNVAYVNGKFKETAKYAYLEAAINISISLVLVFKLGINGVVIGTAISMLFRYIMHVRYIKDNILFKPIKKWIISTLYNIITVAAIVIICKTLFIFQPRSIYSWIFEALLVSVISIVIIFFVTFIVNKNIINTLLNKYLKK